jgi:16S rRNA (cytosine1402-N4)-methyltransferase
MHRPVLLAETLGLLQPRPGQVAVDATVGTAGHAKVFCEKIQPEGFLLGIDRDPQVAELAARELMSAGFTRGRQFEIEVRRFSTVDEALARRRISSLDWLLADLGVHSLHLDLADRGFSLKRDGPLDMRMNPAEGSAPSAADIVNGADEPDLARIFAEYGEERFARQVARAVVRERAKSPITTTGRLREVVAAAIPQRFHPPQVDVATRVFQALRIAVNGELEELDALLVKLPGLLRVGGRAAIISFHSLEDRRVKDAFRLLARVCKCPPESPVCTCGRQPEFRVLTAKPIAASAAEVSENPRARSARLRGIERIRAAQ